MSLHCNSLADKHMALYNRFSQGYENDHFFLKTPFDLI